MAGQQPPPAGLREPPPTPSQVPAARPQRSFWQPHVPPPPLPPQHPALDPRSPQQQPAAHSVWVEPSTEPTVASPVQVNDEMNDEMNVHSAPSSPPPDCSSRQRVHGGGERQAAGHSEAGQGEWAEPRLSPTANGGMDGTEHGEVPERDVRTKEMSDISLAEIRLARVTRDIAALLRIVRRRRRSVAIALRPPPSRPPLPGAAADTYLFCRRLCLPLVPPVGAFSAQKMVGAHVGSMVGSEQPILHARTYVSLHLKAFERPEHSSNRESRRST